MLKNFKSSVCEFNSQYPNHQNPLEKEKERELSEKNEAHINKTCQSLTYKYSKLQKKYKSYGNNIPDKSTLITEDDLNMLLKS